MAKMGKTDPMASFTGGRMLPTGITGPLIFSAGPLTAVIREKLVKIYCRIDKQRKETCKVKLDLLNLLKLNLLNLI